MRKVHRANLVQTEVHAIVIVQSVQSVVSAVSARIGAVGVATRTEAPSAQRGVRKPELTDRQTLRNRSANPELMLAQTTEVNAAQTEMPVRQKTRMA